MKDIENEYDPPTQQKSGYPGFDIELYLVMKVCGVTPFIAITPRFTLT